MRKYFLVLLFSVPGLSQGQTYQPNWESIDSRPTPGWFREAKFGIFIHWGVYSVPGWCTKGNYAEWYQYGLQTNDSARKNFHKAKFGNRTYYDLANDFKAELFNPDEWAKLFERSGARYIVLTSKHHDGFTLWPSPEADKTWGFPWNAVALGPQRDLLGDLFTAVRKTPVHAGMYYSLYEWFNPLWKSDPKKYAAEHAWPQMKELINKYQPDVFWTDGDWEASPETWKSQEFLAWLFNESPVKNRIVVNDRWGAGVRFKHGGIYTPEYQPDLDFEDHYWEESRGMGFSYGYNREEDAWDYNSAQSLVLQLIDKTSRGGNFLLDIGPDEHGKIPPIMQERLLQMGDWLRVNGEAIYATQRWKRASQWSEGRRDYKPANSSGDLLLKLTVDPEPGYAVKEVFYTYNASANSLYAIFPRYPSNKILRLKNMNPPAGIKIRFLSTGEDLAWKQAGNDIEIRLPEYNPDRIKTPYAYVVKLGQFGNFLSKPQIKLEYGKGMLTPQVTMTSPEGAEIYYTTDGSQPTVHSLHYHEPFLQGNTAILKAIAFPGPATSSAQPVMESDAATANAIKYEWINNTKITKTSPGIAFRYFEPSGRIDMNSLKGKETGSGVAATISVEKKKREDKFAFEFSGYILIAKDGIYNFFTESDDGSKLLIDEKEVVDNDGDHGPLEKTGKAALKKGFHKIRVLYFDSGGGNKLKISMQAEGGLKEELPASVLFH